MDIGGIHFSYPVIIFLWAWYTFGVFFFGAYCEARRNGII